jgi:hypothetical protein
MTDPGDPQSQSSPPSPFNPRPLGPRPGGGGCSKPALLGCGGVLLLLAILAIVFVFKAPDFLRWWFGKLETQVMSQLPPDLPAAEREHLRTAFKDVDHGIATGKQMQQKLVQIGSKPNRQLTRDDVLELTAALERLVGKTPAAAPESPAAPKVPTSPTSPTSPAAPASPPAPTSLKI